MRALRTFLVSNGKSLKQFCEESGFNYGSFRVMVIGKYKPSPKMALRIEKATNGKVTRMELLYPKN
jgi:DNA-binding transcriptional regulator YdaS (Cro superfamily)